MQGDEERVRQLALAGIEAEASVAVLAAAGSGRLAASTLYQFVRDPDCPRAPEIAARLVGDARAQAELREIAARVGVAVLPKLAAASSGCVSRRKAQGISISLTPSKRADDQVYMTIEIERPDVTPPRIITVIGGDGLCHREVLPPFSGGAAQTLCAKASPLVAAIADPNSIILLC